MKKTLLILISSLILILGVTCFSYYKNNNNNSDEPNIYEDDPSKINVTNDNYEVELVKKVNKISNDNYLVSPYSIKIALSILKDGSNGNTKSEIENLIGSKFSEIKTAKNRVSVANALFIKDIYKNYIENSYYEKVKDYNSEILYDKFKTPDVINNWVNEKTYKMIPKILDKMDESFVLGIGNALAIDVEWLKDFKCESTYEEEFIKSDNTKINVEMMHQTYGYDIEYFINEDSKGVIIPYKTYDKDGNSSEDGISLEFIGILPNNKAKEYVEKLDKEILDKIDTNKKEIKENEELYLSIPRFKYDYDVKKFKGLLQSLGIKDAFDEDNADLTNIISRNNLDKLGIDNIYVDTAIHKTHIEFTEKGTKAAAVTYFGIAKSSAIIPKEKEKIEMNFNKPFVYMIRDKKTKEMLFFGVVETPNEWKGSTCK